MEAPALTLPPPGRRESTAITATVRERFLAGEDVSSAVRPGVLLSWVRCRDDYRVDPSQARAPSSPEREPCQLLDEKVVVTQLAGLAKAIEDDVAAIGALVAIADSRGGILATWGDSATLRLADDVNLAPRCAWSEPGTGTNAIGTALDTDGPIAIRGSEHWCRGFADWDSAGVALRDQVARRPLGVLGVASRKRPLPTAVLSWLRWAQESIESGLREQALRTFRDLAAVYRGEARKAHGPLAAADTGGRLLLANEDARAYFGIVAPERPWEVTATMPQLHAALRNAVDRAQLDRRWVGLSHIPTAEPGDTLPVAFRPAIRDHRLVGILLSAPNGDRDGEVLSIGDDAGPSQSGRLIGLQDERMVLVSAEEIRYARTDGGAVWLHTDRGRIRLLERNFGALEQRLAEHGFLRVHRRYLVNRRRVTEVAAAPNGCIQLLLDVPTGQPIPVARRRTAEVRRALTLP